jgi:hypothetical protein
MGSEETLLAIHTAVARTEATVGSISERVTEMRHDLSAVKDSVASGQLEDVRRDARLSKLEEAHVARKTGKFELMKWIGGIAAAVVVTVLLTVLGLKK